MQIRNNKEYEKRNIKENKTKKTSESSHLVLGYK